MGSGVQRDLLSVDNLGYSFGCKSNTKIGSRLDKLAAGKICYTNPQQLIKNLEFLMENGITKTMKNIPSIVDTGK